MQENQPTQKPLTEADRRINRARQDDHGLIPPASISLPFLFFVVVLLVVVIPVLRFVVQRLFGN